MNCRVTFLIKAGPPKLTVACGSRDMEEGRLLEEIAPALLDVLSRWRQTDLSGGTVSVETEWSDEEEAA